MSDPNPDLLATSRDINKSMQELEARKEATEDPAEFRALNEKLRKLNQQLQSVNGLLFTERSQSIADAARDVEQAQGELSDAIRDAEQLNQVLASATAFVGLVDTVIKTASKGMV